MNNIVKTPKQSAKTNAAKGPVRSELSHDAIALQAYYIWEKEGRPQNDSLQHWLQAETQLRQRAA